MTIIKAIFAVIAICLIVGLALYILAAVRVFRGVWRDERAIRRHNEQIRESNRNRPHEDGEAL